MDFSSKTANPRHLQDYPDIFAVQQEHEIKDGREPHGPQSYDVLSVYLKGGPRYALGGYLFKAEPPFGVLTAAGVVDQDLQVSARTGVESRVQTRGHVRHPCQALAVIFVRRAALPEGLRDHARGFTGRNCAWRAPESCSWPHALMSSRSREEWALAIACTFHARSGSISACRPQSL